MSLFRSIDWFEVSEPGMLYNPHKWLPHKSGFEIEEEINPNGFYEHIYKCKNGSLVGYGRSMEQGMWLRMSGDAMAEYRNDHQESYMVDWAITTRKRPTRIDYCVDIIAEGAQVRHAVGEILSGNTATRARSFPRVKDTLGEGDTQYIGSPSSKRRMRIYDKAAEMHLLAESWVRCELQIRGEHAQSIAVDMFSSSIHQAGCQAMRDFCNFPFLQWYQHATDAAHNMELSEVPRKPPNFQRWIDEQVLPACRKRFNTSEWYIVEYLIDELKSLT